MENILIFLRDNWKFLVELFVPLVSLVILCLAKKTKIKLPDSLHSQLAVLVPNLVEIAESRFGAGHGDEKLKFVCKEAVSFIVNETNLGSACVAKSYLPWIVEQVESILSAPQKKEKD